MKDVREDVRALALTLISTLVAKHCGFLFRLFCEVGLPNPGIQYGAALTGLGKTQQKMPKFENPVIFPHFRAPPRHYALKLFSTCPRIPSPHPEAVL